jgi:hypothetical protein
LDSLRNESLAYTSFHIPESETVDTFIDKEVDNFVTSGMLQAILKDTCYVDRLNRDCEKIIKWLVEGITKDIYSENNILSAMRWLNKEGI